MTTNTHKIIWWVYTGGPDRERIRRTSTMRGFWPGYDAECSCGWKTQTGGAVRRYIEDEVWYHKHVDTDGPGLPI
ncbi:hypothetical protein GCM10027053_52200 [Intrasporangium mesophilum]